MFDGPSRSELGSALRGEVALVKMRGAHRCARQPTGSTVLVGMQAASGLYGQPSWRVVRWGTAEGSAPLRGGSHARALRAS